MKKSMCLILTGLLFLFSCKSVVKPPESLKPPSQVSYVLSGDNVRNGFKNNSITIVDQQTWKIYNKINLPQSWAQKFSRDPQGRIWVGFSGNFDKNDTLLHIYSPEGNLLKTIEPCTAPKAGISFAKNRAFIACAENGLTGKVAVINLDTLSIEKTIDLKQQNNSNLLLVSSAANEEAVLVAGLTSGDGEGSYTVINIIDPQSLEVKPQIELGENTDIWQIIPHQKGFYLLNVGGWRESKKTAKDVIVIELEKSPKITKIAVEKSPLWGQIDGNLLYSYHDSTYNQPNNDPTRFISRLDLTNNQVKIWQLPNNWNASDLTIIDGKIILTRWLGNSGKEDGLYQFDPNTGNITNLLLNIPDASKVIASD